MEIIPQKLVDLCKTKMEDDDINDEDASLRGNFDIYIGLDPTISDSCSLMIYSRGRCVSEQKDPRSKLRISSSGVDFRAGLTMILIDLDDKLVMTPTKEGIANHKNDAKELVLEEVRREWLLAKINWNERDEPTNSLITLNNH